MNENWGKSFEKSGKYEKYLNKNWNTKEVFDPENEYECKTFSFYNKKNIIILISNINVENDVFFIITTTKIGSAT